jgi:hypothetical protein
VQSVEQLKKTHIVITKCLIEKCSGFYTDTISESVLIECKDPSHHNQVGKNVGGKKVTSPTPTQPTGAVRSSGNTGDEIA